MTLDAVLMSRFLYCTRHAILGTEQNTRSTTTIDGFVTYGDFLMRYDADMAATIRDLAAQVFGESATSMAIVNQQDMCCPELLLFQKHDEFDPLYSSIKKLFKSVTKSSSGAIV
jgi:hypothetical protein